MTDTWHVQFTARDFSAGTDFLTRSLWSRLPHRWLVSVLSGSYSILLGLGIFTLWRVVEARYFPYGRWFVGIFAVAFLLGLLATVASRKVWTRGMQSLWGSNVAPDVVRLDAVGITVEGGMGLTRVPWTLVQDIVRDKGYLYVLYRGVACLYFPVGGFDAPGEFEAFEAKARQLFAGRQSAPSGNPGDAG